MREHLRLSTKSNPGLVYFRKIAVYMTVTLIYCFGAPQAVATDGAENSRETFQDCAFCPEMIALPREITGTKLNVSVYELTWAQYAQAVDAANCPLPKLLKDNSPIVLSDSVRDDFPMTSLPLVEIDCYLDWISGLSGHRYRLPSEGEWQAIAEAARETTEQPRPEFEPGASKDNRHTVRRRLIRRVGGVYHPAIGIFDLFGNASEVVTSERGDSDWVIIRGGDDFHSSDFDRVLGWKRVPAKWSPATVGFRIVSEGVVR